MESFANLSNDELTDQITTWAGRVAAGEARLLALVAELDRREAWAGPGLLSCAHWLSWRLGMGPVAARERVRVARALGGLPRVAAALGAGELSWSQVRAITRVAVAQDEQTYVELAQHATGAQLEKLVRGVRRARRIVEDEADPELAEHRLRTRVRYDPDGTLVLTVRVPAADGAVLLAAVEQACADLDSQRPAGPPGPNPASAAPGSAGASAEAEAPAGEGQHIGAQRPAGTGRAARASLSDGLLHLARTALDALAVGRPDTARRSRSRLVAHVDPLSGWARLADGELLPPTARTGSLAQLPGPERLRRLQAADLTCHDLGRTQRLPSLALRELLGTVDGERCRFPGCTRHRRLHAHHVRYWSDGGATDLDNLVLVCSRHHTLIHVHGFALELAGARTLTVSTPDGTRLPHHPTHPWQPAHQLDPTGAVEPVTLPPSTSGQRLTLDYAVAVLMQQAA